MIYAIIIVCYCFPRKTGPQFNFSRRADQLQHRSTRRNVRNSDSPGARLCFNTDPREEMSAIQIQRAIGSISTPIHGKKMSAIQLQRARGSTSTLIHENACPLLSYNGRADQRRRRSTRMPVRYSATMGALLSYYACPRECLSSKYSDQSCPDRVS